MGIIVSNVLLFGFIRVAKRRATVRFCLIFRPFLNVGLEQVSTVEKKTHHINKKTYKKSYVAINQQQTRKRPTQGRGPTFIMTKMALFTLEMDYSCETGYPYDDSRQIVKSGC